MDRTNVAQYALGLHALGQQLLALGVSDSAALDPQSSMAIELMSLYEIMGNVLAKQVRIVLFFSGRVSNFPHPSKAAPSLFSELCSLMKGIYTAVSCS